jgi:hypothetical protein
MSGSWRPTSGGCARKLAATLASSGSASSSAIAVSCSITSAALAGRASGSRASSDSTSCSSSTGTSARCTLGGVIGSSQAAGKSRSDCAWIAVLRVRPQ